MPEGILIHVNGQREKFTFPDDVDGGLKAMQEAVGGMIEIVNLRDGRDLIVNENGISENLPRNEAATVLFATKFHVYQLILGDALIVDDKDIK